MNRLSGAVVICATCLAVSPAFALTPGMYEYTIKVNMPGAPVNVPEQKMQRCMTAKDIDGNKATDVPSMPNSDCQVSGRTQTDTQFSYHIACTKPQKLDGDVKGTVTATSLNMDMTMHMAQTPTAMTQNISALRLGDCK